MKTAFPNFQSPPACLAVVKTDSQNLLRISKHSLNCHKANTCFVVVKADFPNFYKAPTHFVVVKTDSPSLCMPPTVLCGQNELSEFLKAS